MSRLLLTLLFLQAAPQTVPPQLPGNTTPGQPAAPGSLDPAAATFTSDAGLLLVTVKADKVADYEDALRALQEALSTTSDERRRAMAHGWRVFKSAGPDGKAVPDAKGNILYVHVLYPAVAEADYRPSLLLDELLAGAPAELLAKYRDAIASPPNKLGMSEFAHMAVAPLPKPANASPAAPTLKKPPR